MYYLRIVILLLATVALTIVSVTTYLVVMSHRVVISLDQRSDSREDGGLADFLASENIPQEVPVSSSEQTIDEDQVSRWSIPSDTGGASKQTRDFTGDVVTYHRASPNDAVELLIKETLLEGEEYLMNDIYLVESRHERLLLESTHTEEGKIYYKDPVVSPNGQYLLVRVLCTWPCVRYEVVRMSDGEHIVREELEYFSEAFWLDDGRLYAYREPRERSPGGDIIPHKELVSKNQEEIGVLIDQEITSTTKRVFVEQHSRGLSIMLAYDGTYYRIGDNEHYIKLTDAVLQRFLPDGGSGYPYPIGRVVFDRPFELSPNGRYILYQEMYIPGSEYSNIIYDIETSEKFRVEVINREEVLGGGWSTNDCYGWLEDDRLLCRYDPAYEEDIAYSTVSVSSREPWKVEIDSTVEYSYKDLQP